MKRTKKQLIQTILTFAFAICLMAPITSKATSPSIPTNVLDFYLEGIHIYDEFYMGGNYSNFRFEPLNGELTIKFNGECSLSPTTRYDVSLIDGTTGKTVQSTTLYAINNQYRTFKNLNSSNYYLKFWGSASSDICGVFYISSDGLFY